MGISFNRGMVDSNSPLTDLQNWGLLKDCKGLIIQDTLLEVS